MTDTVKKCPTGRNALELIAHLADMTEVDLREAQALGPVGAEATASAFAIVSLTAQYAILNELIIIRETLEKNSI